MSNAAEEELLRAAEELNHDMDNGMDDLIKHTRHMNKELEKLSQLEKAAWKETDRRSAPAAASAKRYAAPAAPSAFKATKKVIARTEGELEDVAKDVSSSPTQPPVFHDPTLSLHERDHATGYGKAQGDASERKTQNGTQNEMTANVESFLEEFKNPDFDRDDSNAVIRKANELGLQTIKYADLIERQVLGSGASGTVYHGKWRGTDVAIKQIKIVEKSLEQEDLRKMFWNEVRMLAQLHHPNVVAFYGVVTDGPVGTLATVTEYMMNGSLNQFFQNETYREIVKRKRLKILKDVVCGMEYLHSKNIVHFDLKCENLFVDMRNPKQPICKIGDFGLSKIRQKTLVSGDVRGTLPWIAPELFSGKKVSAKVDVFSFGIVMWELLTGEEPYANMHPGAIMGGVVNNTLRPPIPHDCDPAWRLLMERCWSEDPSARPTFTEIRNEITNLLLSMASSLPLKRQGHHGHVPQHLQN